MKKRKGWYLSTPDKKLGFDDEREIAPGVTHTVEFPVTRVIHVPAVNTTLPSFCTTEVFTKPTLCKAGLHATTKLGIKLLYNRPYPANVYLWRVIVSGDISEDKEACKIAGSKRTYLWGIDCSGIIRNLNNRSFFSEDTVTYLLRKRVREEALNLGYIKKGERLI